MTLQSVIPRKPSLSENPSAFLRYRNESRLTENVQLGRVVEYAPSSAPLPTEIRRESDLDAQFLGASDRDGVSNAHC